jgi:hypothetical protein
MLPGNFRRRWCRANLNIVRDILGFVLDFLYAIDVVGGAGDGGGAGAGAQQRGAA